MRWIKSLKKVNPLKKIHTSQKYAPKNKISLKKSLKKIEFTHKSAQKVNLLKKLLKKAAQKSEFT